MEKKYYTPTIEEFHVGFKYEIHAGFERFYKGESDVIEMSGLYYSHQFYRGSDLTMIAHGINKGLNSVRVKYLDREDIESLGFELFDTTKKDEIYFRSTDNLMTKQEVRLWVSKEFGYIEINDIKEKTGCEGSFRGTIKNKSELKKVLKMIGYESK